MQGPEATKPEEQTQAGCLRQGRRTTKWDKEALWGWMGSGPHKSGVRGIQEGKMAAAAGQWWTADLATYGCSFWEVWQWEMGEITAGDRELGGRSVRRCMQGKGSQR